MTEYDLYAFWLSHLGVCNQYKTPTIKIIDTLCFVHKSNKRIIFRKLFITEFSYVIHVFLVHFLKKEKKYFMKSFGLILILLEKS